MIYEMSQAIDTILQAKKYTARVVYGPERVQRERPGLEIVMMRDRGKSDTLGPPTGVQVNPRKVAVRGLAAIAFIYAQSSQEGAMIGDHERVCETLVDALIVALREWGATNRQLPIISEARYLTLQEMAEFETYAEGWPGVVYAVRFTVPRAVFELTYQSETLPPLARPTGTVTGIVNRTDVRLEKAPDDVEPETGCGSED